LDVAMVTRGKNYINTVHFLTQTTRVLGHQCVLTFTRSHYSLNHVF